jgi:hypothetical protein
VIGSKPPAEIKELMLQKVMMNSATLSPPRKAISKYDPKIGLAVPK